uniref:Uncharacterized protein n=1 Tax=Rhodococcus sp. NS1 TaxID=402236 RepID=A0A097SPY4_9NOCA|nr:hypothetical protein LRS1606.151 [Rhodococcus sp. NS1]
MQGQNEGKATTAPYGYMIFPPATVDCRLSIVDCRLSIVDDREGESGMRQQLTTVTRTSLQPARKVSLLVERVGSPLSRGPQPALRAGPGGVDRYDIRPVSSATWALFAVNVDCGAPRLQWDRFDRHIHCRISKKLMDYSSPVWVSSAGRIPE